MCTLKGDIQVVGILQAMVATTPADVEALTKEAVTGIRARITTMAGISVNIFFFT
jgi:hypothetical protein